MGDRDFRFDDSDTFDLNFVLLAVLVSAPVAGAEDLKENKYDKQAVLREFS